ncbi:energy transducer TonB [Rhodobacter sp. CZR27]|uniref:energy transducer TonB family protein n=1 Tax=Rhodobacter sp. CZR27 TaxID=2033869 RepID=UPI000BBED9B2|nr:energy transducer TonB [Rhodobacter sp. CZR27]
MSHLADWRHSLGPRHLRRELAGWSLAALTVAATAAAATTAVMRSENLGRSDALQDAVYMDLAPAASAAIAAPEPAPEVPMTEAPVARPVEEMADLAPDLAPPPPDPRPPAEVEPLPDLAPPVPDSLAYDPPPPPPQQVAEAPPELRPRPRPLHPPVREPVPEAKRETKRTVAPPPQQAQAPQPQAAGRAVAAASKGEVDNLKARWGAEIRKRIQRRTRSAQGMAGEVVVRLTVAQGGSLGAASVARSSGNARLDQLALRAVTSAGRFPSAPTALTDPSYTFTLPITFSR